MSTSAREALEQALGGYDNFIPEGEVNEVSPVEGSSQLSVAVDDLNIRPFHGETDPQIWVDKEKPEHRMMIMLFAQPMSVKQVFLYFGGEWNETKGQTGPIPGTGSYSYAHISQIRKQPWAQKAIAERMEEISGKDQIAARFAEIGSRAIDTLEEVMDNEKAAPNVRANAANSILDRFLGKPTQKIETKNETTVETLGQDAKELQRELEIVEEQIKNVNAAK